MKRSFTVLSLAALLLFLSPISAKAGGSDLDFNEFAYKPGDVALARGWFGPGCCGRRLPKDGPFYTYALPSDVRPSCGDPCVPRGSVRLGAISVVKRQNHTFFGQLRFRVPELDPGTYGVWHCNDPCTAGLGDVVFRSFRVVATDVEGRQWRRIESFKQRWVGWKYKDRVRSERLQRRMEQLAPALRNLASLVRGPRPTQPQDEGSLLPWALVVGGIGFVGGAGFSALRRSLRKLAPGGPRRRPAPDPSPK